MSIARSIGISLSFVGLLVGAGFASGQEVMQYFVSFGSSGIWGMLLAGSIMAVAGTVFLQLGSYFQASEHNVVFSSVAHPVVSKFLDFSVVVTLFSIGFVMLAGAGSNLEQQWGFPTWVGSALMLILVLACGMLDVDKVSRVIGGITPLIIIAVLVVGIYSLLHLPGNFGEVFQVAEAMESPLPNWWISALNYSGLALILAVSMSLVIGGDNLNPQEAGLGGLLGGIMYALLMAVATFSLLVNINIVGNADMPLLAVVNEIHPILGIIMAIIIYLMIFNTAIGMFYALGRRLSARKPENYRQIFIIGCLAGFAISFAGFKVLMQYVYPVLGYIGIALIIVLMVAWLRGFSQIKEEAQRRARVRALLSLRLRPDRHYTAENAEELGAIMQESNLEDEELFDTALNEVSQSLDSDGEVHFSLDEFESDEYQVEELTDTTSFVSEEDLPDEALVEEDEQLGGEEIHSAEYHMTDAQGQVVEFTVHGEPERGQVPVADSNKEKF
ncbi:YkvI family membrane protein [Corynebacterium kutscheri]|uniref:Hypothetical membrane protein n=1 Tax=Corynebacterium kutscheri TaxID=35755 RepID=A0AB38VXE8_9CORY|nr:hypothetical protein [Corynebacterium kutscheri]VEH06909.1 hypothetical membrane protein [Corynebacterium kutscheri]